MSKHLPSDYQKYIHISQYSRWLEDKNRRETWEETVKRYFDFFEEHLKERCEYTLKKDERKELEEAILNLEVMPSMRCLMTAGEALKRDEISGYNCSYTTVNSPRAFDEILYILTCGTGVGFSVETEYVSQLPCISEHFHETDTTIVVADSRIGWAKSLKELISLLYTGQIPKWDLSRVRPAGARLKTFGGRASGPEPLNELFHFFVKIFKNAAGRKLQSIECHDLVCKIADVIVVGGVRRSALISLSNLSDERMRYAKSGQWWIENGQRRLANNSVSYTEKPDVGIFMAEWKALYDSKSGERGFFNRLAAQKQATKTDRRDPNYEFGVNPCSEILLRSNGLCNLSEAVIRPEDTLESLKRKVRLAAILGTMQSTLTNFRYVSREWKKNADEERLLGVSLTGIMDNLLMSGRLDKDQLAITLQELKNVVIETNKKWAKKFGISESVATTCVKPSGTVSQKVLCSSGIHPGYAEYIIRNVRNDVKDPLCQMLIDQGIPHEIDTMSNGNTMVFSFPLKFPKTTVFRNDMSALEQLELWKIYKTHWAEHTVSITVYVKEKEWIDVAAWVYKNFDDITGVSFLPHSDHIYKQAPYEEITKERYEELLDKMPKNIDWTKLQEYEKDDTTTGTRELACVSGICEI